MTGKAVEDDALGKVTRKFWEILRRLMAKKNPLNLERTLGIMQLAIEGTAEPDANSSTWQYILECGWAYDNSHVEFATISVEKCDRGWLCFESLLDSRTSGEDKKSAMDHLNRIFREQVFGHGTYHMNRLYRISRTVFHGYSEGFGSKGTVTKDMVDVHFVLKPICDFDQNNEPIPCKIER